MPNYNLSINSKYNPFTFEELLKPAILATQYHDLLMDLYNQLETQANTLEKLANNTKDAELYNLYKQYADDVRAAQDALYNQGLNAQSRRNALQLKARYASDITPIEEAIKRRDDYNKMYLQSSLSNPDFISDVDPSQIGLGEYMKDISYNPLSRTYNLASLEKNVASAAANLKEQIRSFGFTGRLDENTKIFALKYGLSTQDVMDLSRKLQDPNAQLDDNLLLMIADNALSQSGITNWNRWLSDESFRNQVYGAIQNGMSYAIGTDKLQLHNDAKEATTKTGKEDKSGFPRIDRTAYLFPETKEKVGNYLNEDNTLKSNYAPTAFGFDERAYDLLPIIFKDDKFTNPNFTKTNNVTNQEEVKKKQALIYYNDIKSTLISNGYTEEDINNMSKSDVEEALQDIKEINELKGDLRGTALYRWSMDDELTKAFVNKLKDRGVSVQKVKGLKGDELDLESPGEISLDKEQTGDILFDSKRNKFLIKTGKEYYAFGTDALSSDTQQAIQISISRRDLYKKEMEALEETASRETDPTVILRLLESYDKLENVIVAIDLQLYSYGTELFGYYGKDKLNK